MSAFMMMSVSAMAQDDSGPIAVPYMQEDGFDEIAMTNDDVVKTGINIRKAASEKSEVIGYLYQGCAAWVIKKGEKWTEIYSGGLTGFVKNDLLLYGDDVKGLADHYGIEGVKTTWDGVKLFSAANGNSEIAKLETGESFILLQDNGHWLQVQNGADAIAYLSAEDVTHVLLLDAAVAKDAVYVSLRGGQASGDQDVSETVPDYDEPDYTEPDYNEPDYNEPDYSEPDYTEPDYSETEPPQTNAPETEPPQTNAPETEPPQTNAPETDAPDDDVIDVPDDGYYYDADTDTWRDSNGNVIANPYGSYETEQDYYEDYTDEGEDYIDADSYGGEDYTDTDYSDYTGEDTDTDYSDYTGEDVYTEQETDAYTEPEDTSSYGADDASLLAALIYCEAGNQSYDGMVAVGAVVMNRVYSASFPNTVSDVIYQSGQFTPAYSGSLDSALANGVPSTCYDAAVAALNGENPVGDALYFNTGSGQGIKLGDHQFY